MADPYEKGARALFFSATSLSAYPANCYALFLILIGALLFLAIKKLSDSNALNKRIYIKVDDRTDCAKVLKIDRALFYSALERVRMSNNAMLAVKEIAIKFGELAKVISEDTGKALRESDICRYLKDMPDTQSGVHASVYKDLLCVSDSPYVEVSARVLYEKEINDRGFRMKRKTGSDKFLKESRMICYSDLSLWLACHYSDIGCTKISVLNFAERDALASLEALCHKGNALLLFLDLSHAVEVLEC